MRHVKWGKGCVGISSASSDGSASDTRWDRPVWESVQEWKRGNVVHAPDRSYPVGGQAATSAARGTRSASLLDAESHVVGVKNSWVVAYGSYPCDNVQERAQNGGGDDADMGRAVVSFGSCFR
jgi:hypothetical protein